MPPSWSHPPSKKIQPSKTKTLAHLLHNSVFSTTNTIFIINNATIMVASSRPKTQSSTTPLNTPQHHQSSWPRNHIQKHIEQRKHPTKEITQRLAKHYDLLKLCLKWNDFQENILASFQEPDTTKSLPWSGWKNLPLNKAIKKAKNMLGLQDISILNHGFQLLQMFLK